MKQVLVVYIPVIHAGYISFLKEYAAKTETLYLLDKDLVAEETGFLPEIRAVDTGIIQRMFEGERWFESVRIINKKDFKLLTGVKVIMADEKISRNISEKYLSECEVKFEKVFLRWEEKNVKVARVVKSDKTSNNKFDRQMIRRAGAEAEKSSDWWRHVGAVVVKNGKVLLEAHNQHVPTDNAPYINGDPRDVIEAGKLGFISTAIHAEQLIVTEAARKGISLNGASIYMNVFPCLICAKLIAYAGIKKCFFRTGNAYLNVEDAMKKLGVEIIRVK